MSIRRTRFCVAEMLHTGEYIKVQYEIFSKGSFHVSCVVTYNNSSDTLGNLKSGSSALLFVVLYLVFKHDS